MDVVEKLKKKIAYNYAMEGFLSRYFTLNLITKILAQLQCAYSRYNKIHSFKDK